MPLAQYHIQNDIQNEDTVNKLNARQPAKEQECHYCTSKHPMMKKHCPAWGKRCNKCGEKNHFEAKCDSLSKQSPYKTQGSSRSTRSRYGYDKGTYKKYKKLRRVQHAEHSDCEDSEDEDAHTREWCQNIKTRGMDRKSIKCRMVVEGHNVKFLVDTGASVNVLPEMYAPETLEPYDGKLRMWNNSETKPLGQCRLDVTNPKNSKKYSVPFLVI